MARKRRKSWVDRIDARLRERLIAEVECNLDSFNQIYARWNLCRYCQPRTFRYWAGPLRRKVQEYEARGGHAASTAAWHEYQRRRVAGEPRPDAGANEVQQ